MKIKTKRGRAIIGLAMVAIMVISLLGAIVPMQAAAAPAGHARAGGDISAGATLFAGEEGLRFHATLNDTRFLVGTMGDAEGDIIPIADPTNFRIPVADEGVYDARVTPGVPTNRTITIDRPEIIGNIFRDGTTDSIVGVSIPVGTPIRIRADVNFGGLLVDTDTHGWGTIEIDIRDPDDVQKHVVPEIDLRSIVADASREETPIIDTTGWETGRYRIRIESNPGDCNELDVKSGWMEFTIVTEVFEIEAVKPTVIVGDDMILRVRGRPATNYYITVTDVGPGVSPAIRGDTGHVTHVGLGGLAAWVRTGGGGVGDIRIRTNDADERTYTIKVYRNPMTAAGVPLAVGMFEADTVIDDATPEADEDSVKVKVVEIEVTVDVPRVTVVGEDVIIKVRATGGKTVDVLIDDRILLDNQRLVNNEVEVEWETAGLMVGTYLIEVWVDYVGRADARSVNPDATGATRLTDVGLTTTQPRNVVAVGDDYRLEGTATGVAEVDFVLIGPRGAREMTLIGGYRRDEISVTANRFSDDITIPDGVDTGRWIALVLAPGRDGTLETDWGTAAGRIEHRLVGSTQAQIVAKITDRTVNIAGSDDLLDALKFMVESPRIALDEIAGVPVGKVLNVTGTTNREPGTLITSATIIGPMDLPIEMATVEWPTPDEGVFNISINTTGMVPGNYTIEVNDGEGNIDTVVVELLPAVLLVVKEPAKFEVRNLTISPKEVAPNATVTISATVTNVGDLDGTHNVTLTIDGRVREIRKVTLAGDASKIVTFTVTEAVAGNYTVVVDGQRGSFTVTAPVVQDPEVPGFGAVLAIAGLLAVAYLVLRKRRK